MATDVRSNANLVHCIVCDVENSPQAKFCKACGHGLYEPCVGCEASVLLTQKFCASCGTDLDAALKKRHQKHDEWLAAAVRSAKEYAFDEAVSLLSRVADLQDFRFKEVAESGAKALAKVTAMKAQAESAAGEAITAAHVASESGNRTEVIRLLSTVPTNLMDDTTRRLLAQSKAFSDDVNSLEREVRKAVEKRDWSSAGGLIGQLIAALPDKTEYQKLGKQVTKKLLSEAEKYFIAQRYEKAVTRLGAIPPTCVGEADNELRDRILNAEWLAAQFDAEPFATPMLGRLAVRFAKEFPDDRDAQELVKNLSQTLKQSPRPPRTHLPIWKADRKSWVGGDAGILSFPRCIEFSDQATMRAAAGKFSVAIGIAIQGLGKSRIQEVFQSSKRKKKGLLGGFSRRKKAGCWALDIGSASVKAVRMEERDGNLVVVECYFEEFDSPFCRVGHDKQKSAVLKPIIEKLIAEKDFSEMSVYANLPASSAVTRFVRLPPVSDKQAASLMQSEIEQRIPIAAEDLAIVQTIAPLSEESQYGRAAVVTAAKQIDVDNRFDLLEEIGLEVEWLQTDTVALSNFAAFEFAELWKVPELDEHLEEGDDTKKKKKKVKKTCEALFDNSQELTPSVAIIDSGAATTKFVIVSGETHWSWTIESGGEDLTSALARTTKTVLADAEKLKKNPAAIPSPSGQYASVEQRQEEIRARLEKILIDAKQQNHRFDIKECWCVGGSTGAHGWLRRTVLKQDA